MKHANDTSRRISENFERFNPYAKRATDTNDDDCDVYATLAVAFELSQLRFMLSKGRVDKEVMARLSSRG